MRPVRLAASAGLIAVALGAATIRAQFPQGAYSAIGRAPEYDVAIISDVMVPMRDGTKLATDIYVPAKDGTPLPGTWPVVLERTPYSKTFFYANAPDGTQYAQHGYVMVVQDVRGRYLSEGTFGSYAQEAADGLDTYTWVRKQPWSNGKIAVTGSSYFSVTAQAILVQNPPGLTAAIIRVGSGNYHEDGAWRGGAFLLAHNVNYVFSLAANGKEAMANANVRAGLQSATRDGGAYRLMRLSPLQPGFSPLALAPSYDAWYQDWQQHELYNDYWKATGNGFSEVYSKAPDIPILLIDEWYDAFLGGALDGFAAYSGKGRKGPVQLLIGGGEHGSVYSLKPTAGDVDMGPGSAISVRDEMFRWFEQYLKGKDQGLKAQHSVRAFRIEALEGARTATEGMLRAWGTWQQFGEWPPKDAVATKFYLGTGRTLSESASNTAAKLTYAYDPLDPTPSVAAGVSSGNPVQAGPADQRCAPRLPQCNGSNMPLSARPDVLTFATPPLAEDRDVTGAITAKLWVSSSAVDTDFAVTLIDQYPPSPDYPEGYALNVQNGLVRARLRSFRQDGPGYRLIYGLRNEPLVPGTLYEVTVDLWSASYLFKAGHKIRVDVASAAFPQFDANPNTGEPFATRTMHPIVASNTVHVGGATPSHIVLPLRR